MNADNTQTHTPDDELSVYEIGYVLIPAIAEDDVMDEVDTLKDVVTSNDGAILESGEPNYIDLAYPMEHVMNEKRQEFKNAYFGWMQFEVEPGRVSEIQEAIQDNDHVIRALCIAIDRDQVGEPVNDEEADEDDEKKEEADSEEVDEAIDELVIE